MRKLERIKIDAFELWCWRHLPSITWTDRNKNIWVINNIKLELKLESRIVKASLCYFGHGLRTGGMEYEVMLGGMGDKEGDHGKDGWIA